MPDAKSIYSILIYGVSIIPTTLGLLMLFFADPKNRELKPYLLSRKALAIAYIAMGALNILEIVVMGDQLGEDKFKTANITLIIASCQANLFTYALIILIDPAFSSLRWNKWQWGFISGGCIGIISGLFLDLPIWINVVFFLFLAFYLYQLIFYTFLYLKKKKSYINRVDNYFSGNEIYLLRWIDIAFFSALSIGLCALIMVLFTSIWFGNFFSIACCVFYLLFTVKYLEYPRLFEKLQPVIKPPQDDIRSTEADKQRNTLEQKLELWIREKHFLQPGITTRDLSQKLGIKRHTVIFYINVHMQMNFKNWLLYLKQKYHHPTLKDAEAQSANSLNLFTRFEKLMKSEKLYLIPDLQREDAAKRLHTNTVYLNEAVREHTRKSFGDYINDLRLDHARNILNDPKENHKLFSIIATESGFKSLRTFNRKFKERFGITPGEESCRDKRRL